MNNKYLESHPYFETETNDDCGVYHLVQHTVIEDKERLVMWPDGRQVYCAQRTWDNDQTREDSKGVLFTFTDESYEEKMDDEEYVLQIFMRTFNL